MVEITPRPLSLSGISAADKVYDGSRDATLSGGSLANLVAGETLGLTLAVDSTPPTSAPASRSRAPRCWSTAPAWRRTTRWPATMRYLRGASITQRLLTVAGVLAADKVYDGNRDALLSGGSLVNLVPGETLTLALGPGLFDTADAGVDKPVTATATLGNGNAQSSNYAARERRGTRHHGVHQPSVPDVERCRRCRQGL